MKVPPLEDCQIVEQPSPLAASYSHKYQIESVDCSIHSAPCTDHCRAPVPVLYLCYWKWFCFDGISHLLRLCCLMFTLFFRIPTGTERGIQWAERAPSQLTMSRKGKESSQGGNSVLCRKYQRGVCVCVSMSTCMCGLYATFTLTLKQCLR